MSVDLSNDFKEVVRSQTDIVSLIGESILLRPAHGGREYVGLCPFHDDHNPSLHVYPDRQTFRCWVCNEGGDCFSFVVKHDRVDFREALELLARRANLPIPQRRSALGEKSAKTDLLEILSWAEQLFHRTLLEAPSAEPARRYLRERGFSKKIVTQFRLGYHPDDWEWIQKEARGRFTPQQLASACLVKKQDGGTRFSDYFTSRVLFPIHNERGAAVGFGGRVLPGQTDRFGKYFNSPESAVFHKSRLLYALDHARQGLRDTGTVVVTEGYTDCITAHQAGLTNVVATLGTALTVEQVATLKRFARKVVLVYDGDEAGQRAAERAVSRFLAQDVDLRVLTLPAGQDPADYIAQHGVQALAEMINDAPEAFDFVFESLRSRFGVETIDGRQQLIASVLDFMAGVPRIEGTTRERDLLRLVAERTRILGPDGEARIRAEYRAARQRRGPREKIAYDTTRSVPITELSEHVTRLLTNRLDRADREECELVEALIAVPSLTAYAAADLEPGDFRNIVLRRIVEVLFRFCGDDPQNCFVKLLAALDEEHEIKSVAVHLDEQGRKRNIARKLGGTHAAAEDCPALLRQLIDRLQWRDEVRSHEQTTLKLSASYDNTVPSDRDSEEELLRQFIQFHEKRASQRPTGT